MTLQASGLIKMSEIKAELASASNSLRVYSAAAKAVTNDVKFDIPDALSDFYSYPPATTTTTTTTTTTAAPTTTTTTTTTEAPAQATFTGFVSIESEAAACAGGEYGLVTITVYGTTLCDATSVRALSSVTAGNVYNDFTSNQIFYIARLSNVRQFQRDGSAQTGTPQAACVSCPTTTTTTAAPTTTTTTAAPTTTTTTAAPTTTTTTAAPTTTTTTAAPIYSLVDLSHTCGTDGCETGTISRIYFIDADTAAFIANSYAFGGIGGGSVNTCTAIARDINGNPITRRHYESLAGVCWNITSGTFAINTQQC